MEMIYSRELGRSVAPDAKTTASAKSFSMTDALALYHRLKGNGKTKLFFESSERSMRYLTDCLGHDDLAAIEISDAGRFRDYLFDRGMSSSSVKRIFSSVRAIVYLHLRIAVRAARDAIKTQRLDKLRPRTLDRATVTFYP